MDSTTLRKHAKGACGKKAPQTVLPSSHQIINTGLANSSNYSVVGKGRLKDKQSHVCVRCPQAAKSKPADGDEAADGDEDDEYADEEEPAVKFEEEEAEEHDEL